uniref:Rar1 protein, putative n=1 Tax=Solanum demissum TaxID=50514 RepID=Q6L4A8_SOLDE|nr:Rar1 protein, putative [Solanum demissum]
MRELLPCIITFNSLRRCKTGKHTTEKPVIATPSATKNKAIPVPVSVPAPMTNASPKEACPRCHQGFFCSDHGSQPREAIPKASNTVTSVPSGSNTVVQQDHPAPVKKKIDINEPQICKNKSCGKTFTEKENHDTACSYHPGPAIFHDRMKGWKCCDVHVKEFDEFMTIPACTKGWHNADPVS